MCGEVNGNGALALENGEVAAVPGPVGGTVDIQVGAQTIHIAVPDEDIRAGARGSAEDCAANGVYVGARSFAVGHPWGETEFYRHGSNSWSSTRWWHLGKKPWRVGTTRIEH